MLPLAASATIMPVNSPSRMRVISVWRPLLRFSRTSFSTSAWTLGFSRR